MTATEFFRHVADRLEQADKHPYGPEHTPDERPIVAESCVVLCGGDHDRARSLWKQIAIDCGGYMPHAAACALIRASHAYSLIPDVEAPAL